jgi:cyclophilin family peptidyl-prolyl cis-trans isomerase
MQQRSHVFAPVRAASAAALTLVALTAYGGGGDSGGGTPTASVASMSVNATRYGQPATVTINGSALDSTLAVTSTACASMTLLSAAPFVSTSTTAYYSCTVSGALTGSVVAKSNGTQVGAASFTVLQPVVTLAVTNGLAVNGIITITLAADKAPKTVTNFLNYVNSGFYNGTIFHRDVASFVMQAGGYAAPVTDRSTATLKTGVLAPIAVENTGLSNVTWSIAMANANTSSNTVTTTSQFYFNLNNNTSLDGGYAVFGAVTAGTAVAQAILAAPDYCVLDTFPSGASETDCLPVPNAVITTATQTQ